MSDRWTDSLSDYLDRDLAETERRSLERHLETCGECRTTLEALRRVQMRARTLLDPPAPDDLWAGIASRIGPAGSLSVPHERGRILAFPARRRTPALATAAGFALLLASAGAVWLALRPHAPARPVGGAAVAPGMPAQAASFDAAQVEGEIVQLQQALERGRGKLDPKTVEVLERNLAVIRAATEDARRALEQDPANRELQRYFASTVGSKIELMRRATALVGA